MGTMAEGFDRWVKALDSELESEGKDHKAFDATELVSAYDGMKSPREFLGRPPIGKARRKRFASAIVKGWHLLAIYLVALFLIGGVADVSENDVLRVRALERRELTLDEDYKSHKLTRKEYISGTSSNSWDHALALIDVHFHVVEFVGAMVVCILVPLAFRLGLLAARNRFERFPGSQPTSLRAFFDPRITAT